MLDKEIQGRKDIVEVGRLLYERGLLVAADGNLSIRLGSNEILITSTGFCKGMLTPDQITKIDLDGNILSGLKPARDVRMHLSVYRCRPDAHAVVHAHPPVATGFSMSNVNFDKVTLPEVLFSIGKVEKTEYATPTTAEVPISVEKKLHESPECEALILANHGALVFGKDIMDAYYKMETLEMFLKSTLVSKFLGTESALTDNQVQKIMALKKGIPVDSVAEGEQGLSNVNIESLVAQVVGEVIKRLNK